MVCLFFQENNLYNSFLSNFSVENYIDDLPSDYIDIYVTPLKFLRVINEVVGVSFN